MEQLSKAEILQETVKFYSEDVSRRCIVEGSGCVYNGYKGLESVHCAVGRCFKPDYKAQGTKFKGNSDTGVVDLLHDHELKSIDFLLEPQYHGHEIEFWFELQHLHDTDLFWDEEGLTKLGEKKVKDIEDLFVNEKSLSYICRTKKE